MNFYRYSSDCDQRHCQTKQNFDQHLFIEDGLQNIPLIGKYTKTVIINRNCL